MDASDAISSKVDLLNTLLDNDYGVVPVTIVPFSTTAFLMTSFSIQVENPYQKWPVFPNVDKSYNRMMINERRV